MTREQFVSDEAYAEYLKEISTIVYDTTTEHDLDAYIESQITDADLAQQEIEYMEEHNLTHCSTCGAIIPDTETICDICKQIEFETAYSLCTICGSIIDPSETYCDDCKSKL